jgi:serine/threonine protein phosphatase PrpC
MKSTKKYSDKDKKFKLEPFFFYEGDLNKPWKISGDKAVINLTHGNGFLAVADAVTRKITTQKRSYPKEFLGPQVATIFTQIGQQIYQDFDYKNNGMDNLLQELNTMIKDFNVAHGYNYQDEENYDMGECVGICTVIEGGRLYWGGLEDCYINVLRGKNFQDQVQMDHHIVDSYSYMQKKAAQQPKRTEEEIWCQDLRNNPEAADENGNRVGWGCFNGEIEAKNFWQTGSVELQPGDVIWLVSDGVLPILEKTEIEDYILHQADNRGTKSQQKLSELIDRYSRELANYTGLAIDRRDISRLEKRLQKDKDDVSHKIYSLNKEKTLVQVKVE